MIDRQGAWAAIIWVFCCTVALLIRMILVALLGVWTPVGVVLQSGAVLPGETGYLLTVHPFVFAVVALSPVVVGGAMAMYYINRTHRPRE